MTTQIKAIQGTELETFENEVNKQSRELNAFATQTHVVQRQIHILYVAFLFYKGEKK